MEPKDFIGPAIAAVSIIIAIANARYTRSKDQGTEWAKKFEEIDRQFQEFNDVLSRLSVIEKQVEVFWKHVSFSSSQALHSPHTPGLDRLIEKFQRELIDDVELYEFKRLLQTIVEDEDETPFRQKAARDVLAMIHLRYEIGGR